MSAETTVPILAINSPRLEEDFEGVVVAPGNVFAVVVQQLATGNDGRSKSLDIGMTPGFVQLRLFLDVRFESFLLDSFAQFFRRHLLRVESDRQQIMVPFVADQLNARKPCQGLFHPIGSIFSHQRQSLAHVGDVESHGRGAGRRRCLGHGTTAA